MNQASLLRRAALAVAGGLALYAAHPPLDVGWLGLLALVPLSALARELVDDPRPLRSALAWGTLAGCAFFGPLLTWILNLQEVVAWLLLVPFQGLYVGLFLAAVVAWGRRPLRPLAIVVAWVAVETLRSIFPLGGFPWGVLGYSQHDGGLLLGLARYAGVLGVSAACAGVAVSIEEAWHRAALALRARDNAQVRAPRLVLQQGAPLLGVTGIVVIAAIVGGAAWPRQTGVLDIAAIQGFDVEGSTGRTLPRSLVVADKMRAVTAQAVAEGGPPDLTIWPENAVDGDVSTYPELAEIVSDAVDLLDGAPLLAGVIVDGPRPSTFENTLVVFDESARPTQRYVKRKLVPFGEYVPLRPLLGWFPPLKRVPSDGIPGAEATLLGAAGAEVGAVICFEVIFPSLVHDLVREGADVLVVATNNTSFGRGAASDQHLAFSQLRAVETGRWVVHAALSGSSAVIDPQGRKHQVTDLYSQAVVRADVPLLEGITPATRVGDGVGYAALALLLGGLAGVALQRRRTGSEVPGERPMT